VSLTNVGPLNGLTATFPS